jgi:polyribonucleotide nucleotidyltransferase
VLKEGDEVMVKVLEVDRQGKIRLSRKEALQETGGDQINLGGGSAGAPEE